MAMSTGLRAKVKAVAANLSLAALFSVVIVQIIGTVSPAANSWPQLGLFFIVGIFFAWWVSWLDERWKDAATEDSDADAAPAASASTKAQPGQPEWIEDSGEPT